MGAKLSIAITGAGVISCAGHGRDRLWQFALENRSGLGADGLGRIADASPVGLAVRACADALRESGWESLGDDDGLIVATTVGQIPLWEEPFARWVRRLPDAETADREFAAAVVHQPLGSVADAIADELRFSGKRMVVASACSAATQALGLAAEWVAQGRVRRCLVGAVEVLSDLTTEGFRSLKLLSPTVGKPFDRDRNGINLSEGSAFFCLESAAGATVSPLAIIAGSGFSTDAYHMAAPHPEGRGSFEAMAIALKRAGLHPAQIDWIHAHGTGSSANDLSEGAAIAQLFGNDGPWVSSTKAIHGHALGASGALEAALCLEAFRHQTVLRTAGLQNPDPAIRVKHPADHLRTPLRHILKNTLGFGGNNAALVLSAGGTA